MGFLKLMFNVGNAEGIREAMRISYKKARKRASQGSLDSEFNPHISDLLGAMASRMVVRRIAVDPAVLWHEIAPFGVISDEEVAVEALAEYAVYVELPGDPKLAGLREAVNSWIRRTPPDHEMLPLLTNPLAESCRWWGLLESDVTEQLRLLRQGRDDLS